MHRPTGEADGAPAPRPPDGALTTIGCGAAHAAASKVAATTDTPRAASEKRARRKNPAKGSASFSLFGKRLDVDQGTVEQQASGRRLLLQPSAKSAEDDVLLVA